MNSLLNLGRCLGDVPSPSFQRYYLYQVVQSLEHCTKITFRYDSRSNQLDSSSSGQTQSDSHVAHKSGTNCLAIDPQTSRYLFTGGADTSIRMWDLNETSTTDSPQQTLTYSPSATLSRTDRLMHTHALTSLSIYPFDALPETLLSTSYDKSILLSAITPSSLQAVHSSALDFTPHTHAISPHPSSSPLVAIGTTHPAIRLFDLRTGLLTHSLPGHNGAVYALSFHTSPDYPHVLISGAVDGRILLFDIRRANPAFASLDLDDAVGYPASPFADPAESRPSNLHLNFNARAHVGPVTGLAMAASGNHLVSAGHDGRIRVWDLSIGRNDLVHFGPRIRNSRNGNLAPIVLPQTVGKAGREVVLWPNDDGRGEIFLQSMREGTMLQVLKTQSVKRSNVQSKTAATQRLTDKGRINQLAIRSGGGIVGGCEGIELYSAHGDGSVCVWRPALQDGQDDEVDAVANREEADETANDMSNLPRLPSDGGLSDQSSRKRKRDIIGDLVQGLTKRQVTFS